MAAAVEADAEVALEVGLVVVEAVAGMHRQMNVAVRGKAKAAASVASATVQSVCLTVFAPSPPHTKPPGPRLPEC